MSYTSICVYLGFKFLLWYFVWIHGILYVHIYVFLSLCLYVWIHGIRYVHIYVFSSFSNVHVNVLLSLMCPFRCIWRLLHPHEVFLGFSFLFITVTLFASLILMYCWAMLLNLVSIIFCFIFSQSNVHRERRKVPDLPCTICKGSGRIKCRCCKGRGLSLSIYIYCKGRCLFLYLYIYIYCVYIYRNGFTLMVSY